MAFPRIPFTLRQLFVSAYLLGMMGLTVGVVTVLQERWKIHSLADLAINGRSLVERLAVDSRFALLQGATENLITPLETVVNYPNVTGVLVMTDAGRTLALKGVIPIENLNFRNIVVSEKSGYSVYEDHLIAFAPVQFPSSETLTDSPYRERPSDLPDARDENNKSARTLGFIVLNLSLAKLKADAGVINNFILIVMASGSLAVTLTLFWLLELLTKPIKNLAGVMSDPSTAKTFRPVTVCGVKEAQTIASAFNALIGTLAQFSRELSESKAEIERQNVLLTQTVAEQVAELKAQNAQLDIARQQAEDGSRAKSEFIAQMSHEIRTPLHLLIGNISLLKRTQLTDRQAQLRAMMEEEADRLLREINGILDFSKLEARRLTLKEKPCQLQPLIVRTLQPFEHRARAKNLQFSLSIDPMIPDWFRADGEQIGRILGILLDNALKFTAQGKVEVQVDCPRRAADKCAVRLVVRDTGIGISKEQQEKIFEPFTQADSSTTRKYNGTGLGLTILSQLVALMKGQRHLRSELGRGSLFSIVLPLALSEPANEPPLERLEPPDQALRNLVAPQDEAISARRLRKVALQGGGRVLVVDNERNTRLYTQFVLLDLNVEVLTAASGTEALSLCEQQRFDLILMDIRMPEMDGLEVTRQIRKDRASLNTRAPIIGLTADLLNLDRQDWQAAGMNGCHNKPLKAEDLEEIFMAWGIGQSPKGSSLRSFFNRYKVNPSTTSSVETS